MSVLVKGMEMPKCCDICPFGYWSNLWQTGACTLIEEKCFADFSVEYREKRSDNCPLVEVPTPHGRLIDVDAFKAGYGMKNDCADCGKENHGKVRRCKYDYIYSKMDFCSWIDDADVVIEADGVQ